MTSPENEKPYTREELDEIASNRDAIEGLTMSHSSIERLLATARLAFERAPSEGRGPRQSYVAAMAILQSDLYADADDELRSAVDAALAALPSLVSDPTDTERLDWLVEDCKEGGRKHFCWNQPVDVRAFIDLARRPKEAP